jgi:hypothetical protein
MAKHRGGRATRRESEDDLQRDDRGTGHAASKGKKKLDKELDNTLEDSFPSSDPRAISQPTKTEPAGDPKVKPYGGSFPIACSIAPRGRTIPTKFLAARTCR